MKRLLLTITLALVTVFTVHESELLGYWKSPRHPYLLKASGLMLMCPTGGPYGATATNHWDVRNGVFYWDNRPYKIIAINDRQFVYQGLSGDETGYVMILYRTTRADAERD